ncbi:MAG: ISLre2 family transposase [Clostridiaceae bacterium]|nr:ISLre2 family transposase [Clostridiaceae bacterium]
MYTISLNESALNFKTLEQRIYRTICEIACDTLRGVLDVLDKMLMATRDTSKYRHKGKKQTHIHTVMGVIEYSRRIYECYNEDGKKQYVYLLDQYLENETVGHVSTNLAEKIVERALEESYRKTSQAVKSTTNANLSHTTAWNLIQKVGAKLQDKEHQLVDKYEQGMLNGDREVDVLFQEADGVLLSMQGKDRPQKGRKKEMKVAVNYEGFKKRKGQKKGYQVHNKTVCAGFHKSQNFKRLWDAQVAAQYNTDEIKVRIVNGDGDPWIKPDLEQEGVHFQLDPFHISREVLRKVPDKKQARQLNKLLRQGRVRESFEYLTNLLIEYAHEEDKFRKLEELYNYLSNNREGLVPYRLRELELPELPDGLMYRGMGTMEGNVCDIITLRMKNRKMSWSEEGANNLAKLLAARGSGVLYEQLDEVFDCTISEEMLDEMIEVVQLSAAEANRKPKKSKVYPMPSAPIPYEGQSLTEGRKAIRNLVENRIASDLNFIY